MEELGEPSTQPFRREQRSAPRNGKGEGRPLLWSKTPKPTLLAKNIPPQLRNCHTPRCVTHGSSQRGRPRNATKPGDDGAYDLGCDSNGTSEFFKQLKFHFIKVPLKKAWGGPSKMHHFCPKISRFQNLRFGLASDLEKMQRWLGHGFRSGHYC